ncbi:MAG: hypothetical protein IT291_08040 [Deltaproteobacteria bacterium]|nr:hypothetical protein [Deltaproteobacteria bacterium]
MDDSSNITRILFVDKDERSFQIWQCIAAAIQNLPPIELIHASNASHGLLMIGQIKPDCIVLNFGDEDHSELDTFLKNLLETHPPIIVQAEEEFFDTRRENVFFVEQSGSLESIHKTLLAAIESTNNSSRKNSSCH